MFRRTRRMTFVAAMVGLIAMPDIAAAQGVPLPRPRPLEALAAPPPVLPEEPSACQLRLRQDIAQYEPWFPIVGSDGCGAEDVVRLDAVVLPNRARVMVTPPAILRCEMAEAVAHWVRENLAPAAAGLGAPLGGIENYSSYDCRRRNRIEGAKMSEHGRANALDIRALRLADGRIIAMTDVTVSKAWREAVRASACARFTTVLGPGSDGHHESHIHIDLAQRNRGFRLCQWDVRDTAEVAPVSATPEDSIPMPRPRPAADNLERRP